jgi:tetratricopeptide (TPR) repeat protein
MPNDTTNCCYFNCYRPLAGDHAGAEQALSQATLWPGGAGEDAEVCRALALLRWEQGRTEEALVLLERAAALWEEEEVTYEESACQVLRALLLVEEGRASDAVGLLREALPPLADPRLTFYGGLALALGSRCAGSRKRRARCETKACLSCLARPARPTSMRSA